MTNKEAIEELKRDIHNAKVTRHLSEHYKMAIKALEQEPCEDCISRQAVLEAFNLSEKTRKYGGDHSGYDTIMLYEIQDVIEDLPSVQPKPKTGHWKRISIDKYSQHAMYWYRCDRCGEDNLGNTDWCPNCGAKMEEKEENNG